MQVTRSCRASFALGKAPKVESDCDDREHDSFSTLKLTGDPDNRQIYRIDHDDRNGLQVIEF